MVTKQPILMSGTIRENITMGRADLSDESVYRAAVLCQAIGFIENDHGGVGEERRVGRIDREITQTVQGLAKMFKEFEKLEDSIIKVKDIDMKQILLETFKYGDLLTYDKIKHCPEDFVSFASVVAQEKGALNLGWVDLLIMYEW